MSIERRRQEAKNRAVSVMQSAAVYVALIVGALVLIGPFLWMLSTSFKPKTEIFKFPPTLWPEGFSLKNYVTVLTEAPIGRYFINSVLISAITTSVTVFLVSLAAYSFARLEFKGKNFLFVALMASLISPGIATLIPNFMIVRAAGLLDTYAGIFLPYIGWNIAGNLLIMRGFFRAIPSSIEDAAKLDNCSVFDIYFKIALPLVEAGLATLAIFVWLSAWDEFMWVLTVTSGDAVRTMSVGLYIFQGPYITDWNLLTAAVTLGVAPSIVFFLLMQRYFVPTAAFEAYKG